MHKGGVKMESLNKPTPTLLCVDDVAQILRVTPKTVRNLISNGDIKAIRIGRLIRIFDEDFINYLTRST